MRVVMWQLLTGAKKMHELHIIHRDIKTESILIGDITASRLRLWARHVYDVHFHGPPSPARSFSLSLTDSLGPPIIPVPPLRTCLAQPLSMPPDFAAPLSRKRPHRPDFLV